MYKVDKSIWKPIWDNILKHHCHEIVSMRQQHNSELNCSFEASTQWYCDYLGISVITIEQVDNGHERWNQWFFKSEEEFTLFLIRWS